MIAPVPVHCFSITFQDEMKILTDEKQKLEKENTVLKRTNSFYNLPHPRASLPKIEKSPVVKTTTSDYHRNCYKNTGNKS